jgi:hypothetical protein
MGWQLKCDSYKLHPINQFIAHILVASLLRGL